LAAGCRRKIDPSIQAAILSYAKAMRGAPDVVTCRICYLLGTCWVDGLFLIIIFWESKLDICRMQTIEKSAGLDIIAYKYCEATNNKPRSRSCRIHCMMAKKSPGSQGRRMISHAVMGFKRAARYRAYLVSVEKLIMNYIIFTNLDK